ncbi:hypothetical protein H8K33_11920 [Undibacterium amnicola]|uniref:Calcium-binding protein n=1 Tax=Undibacterium amnicola TaxID=1834038 RepID=A0ABR6XTJ7_9BURK|nr:hypothetical protein [Undibacterium amnicola]MBC3832222.1 hypothetical protein [Undibacterium amnicola]
MATMISPGQYRISLANETLTSSTSWNTLIGTSTNQTLKLMGLYYGTSGTIDMGGGSDTLIINVNAKARLDLKNTEYVYAGAGKSVSLQLMNTSGSTITTDGTIKEITGGGGKEHVTFEHGLADAGTRPNGNSVVTVSLGGGTQDVVNFEHATRVVNLPGGGSYTQNAWVIYATPTGYAAYNNFRDYTVNVLSTAEQLTYNGDVYTPGSTNLLISNVTFNWAANVANTNFIVNVPSVNVYFRTGGVNSFLDNSAVFVTTNNVGLAQEAGISARAVAEEGVIRVEAGISTDDSAEHLFIGTTGADTMAASTTNATVLYGFAGNDDLTGNAGADTMFGGIGDDTITGGSGDSIYGNEDNDLVVGFATGTVIVDGGTGANTLRVDSTAAIAGLAAATDAALVNVQTVTAATATTGVAINLSAQSEAFTIIGSGEQDTITVGQAADTLTTGARADTVVFGTAGSLAAAIDTLIDYEDDVLDFGGDAVLVGAGGAVVAATSVSTSTNGKVTFDAADDTLAEKIAAVRADSRLDAANSVAVFSDGADSYVYYAGAATGNADDQIVKLTGQSSLDKIVVSAGNVTLDTEPPVSGLTTTLSLLPTTTSWTGAPGGATPTGYTPGNDGNANTSQGDGVNGATNQLIRNAGGNFGTHVQGGDDTYGVVAVPAGLWSTGLNMFGTTYTNLYIGTNGYVTFGKGFSGYSPSGIAGFTRSPMIAAQYDDLYTDQGARNITNGAGSGTSQNSHNMYYFIDGDKIVFTWDNVGLYSSASSSTSGNLGSAFQIIIHKPTGDAVADQNFGMEIRYEEVTQQSAGATAGWTAGDQVNYGLINDGSVLSTVATSASNVGVNGVWAWEVNGGVVAAPYFVPDIGIDASGVDVASLSFRNAMPTGFTISGDGNGYGFEMAAAVANGANSTAVLNTIASPVWNLWKEQYKDGVATITVTPTGAANAVATTLDVNIFSNGLDTVTRIGGEFGTTLQVTATSSSLNSASNTDISTITTVQATNAALIDLSNQTEDFDIAGSAGADTLGGGQGNDTINGGLNNDVLTGGLGVDVFTVGAGVDTISDLGNGADVLTVAVGATANATLANGWTATAGTNNRGTASIDAAGFDVNLTSADGTSANGWIITNSGTAVNIDGSGQNDTITGGAGDDDIDGNLGDDSISGGAGADSFWVIDGTDSINDLGNGADQVTIGGGATMNATLAANWTPTNSTTNSGTANVNAAGFNVDLSSAGGVWTVTNSAVTAVSVTGSAGDDTISGNNGNDTIVGGGGTDNLSGGAGDDTFRYAAWAELAGETVDGGAHTTGDTIVFTSGISGENFHTAFGGVTNLERVQLSGANDINLGTDMVGSGITTILTGAGTTSIRNDDPVLSGITIDATAMLDNLVLTLSDTGGATDFTVTNLRGDLTASALTTGTLSASAAEGAGFAVSMTGGNTVDTFIGSQGADTLTGNAGDDTLTGGAGADTFTVTAGTDTITDFGNGADILTIAAASAAVVTLGGGFNGAASTSNDGTGSINANGFAIDMTSATGANGWSITNSGAGGIWLIGSAQNDTVVGGAGNETVWGRGGTNTLTGGGGVDAFGAEGNDTITDLGFGGADTLSANWGSLDVTLGGNWTATASSERTSGAATNMDVAGFNVNLAAIGGTSGWNITNSGAASSITGSANNDTITGTAGIDVINVSSGVDTVVVGSSSATGIDEVTNFSSNDFIKFVAANNYIHDTNNWDGEVSLGAALVAVAASWNGSNGSAVGFTYLGLQYVFIESTAGANSYDANDAVVQLVGTNLASLTSANFIL